MQSSPAAKGGSVCAACGYPNRPGIRFCESCGEPLAIAESKSAPPRGTKASLQAQRYTDYRDSHCAHPH